MKLIYILLTLAPWIAIADDAEHNQTAHVIKTKILTKLKKAPKHNGFCDLYLYMNHKGSKAYIKSVKTSGDYKLCKQTRKAVPVKKSFTYRHPEKIIRLHISTED